MRSKWIIPSLIVLLVGMLGIFVYLLVSLKVPVNPEEPYFVLSNEKIFGVDWPVDRFIPVYLWRYKENGGIFLKVAYRNKKGEIKIANVFAGGKWEETANSKVKVNGEIDAESYKFRSGERIIVTYLRGAEKETERALVLEVLCGENPALCLQEKYVESIGGLRLAPTTSEFPPQVVVPTVNIFNKDAK